MRGLWGLGLLALAISIAVATFGQRRGQETIGKLPGVGASSRSAQNALEPRLAERRKPLTKRPEATPSVIPPAALFNFSPEGFEAAWTHIYSNFTPESERNLFLRQIVTRMASLGHMKEALDAITRSFSNGSVRSGLINGCFSYCSSPEAFLAAYASLQTVTDKNAAESGLRHSIAHYMTATEGRVDLSKYHFDFLSKEKFDSAMISAAGDYFIQMSKESPEGASKALQAVLGMGFDDSATGKFLGEIARLIPFESWNEYSLRADKLDPEIGKQIAAAMVAEDPARAVTIVAKGGGESVLASAVYAWGRLDRSKALEWFEQARSGLGNQEYTGAVKGISRLLADEGSFDKAKELANTIGDQVVQRAFHDKIWGWERDALRGEVGKNPMATLDALVGGKPPHDEYWIEEAMRTWMAKDFNKAQEWYQQNWKSLPATKSQYVAAAFAGQAVKQGDVATARQWATYIQNPKTKQRIETGIANAEGSPPQ